MRTPTSSTTSSPRRSFAEPEDDLLSDGTQYCSPKRKSRKRRDSSSSDGDAGEDSGINSMKSVLTVADKDKVIIEIQKSEQKTAELYDEIRQVVEKFAEKQNTKENELKHLRALRWSISPLRYMPDEVLGEIFESYVLELGGSPWILTRVSSSFRKAAFATRKIWTRINLTNTIKSRHSSTPRFSRGRENCLTVSHLKSALSRSGKTLLDIRITRCTLEMASLLASECVRWGSLKLSRTNNKLDDEIMLALFKQTKPATKLLSVTIRMVENYKALAQWLGKARPSSLELSHCNISKFLQVKGWPELRELRINNASTTKSAALNVVPGAGLKNVLTSSASHLTYLEIRNVPPDAVPWLGPITFPQLLELKLEMVDKWWLYRGDKLEKLWLKPPSPAPEDLSILYPGLTHLDYDATNAHLMLESIIAPRLDFMALRHVREAEPGKNFIWLNKDGSLSQLATRQLDLHEVSVPPKQFLAALRPHHKVEELKLNYCRVPISFLQVFGNKPTRKYPMLCSNLQRLSIGIFHSDRKADDARYKELFKDIAKARKEYEHPLRELLVRLCWDQEPKDFANLEEVD